MTSRTACILDADAAVSKQDDDVTVYVYVQSSVFTLTCELPLNVFTF